MTVVDGQDTAPSSGQAPSSAFPRILSVENLRSVAGWEEGGGYGGRGCLLALSMAVDSSHASKPACESIISGNAVLHESSCSDPVEGVWICREGADM